MKPQKKVTNDRASEYDSAIAFSFSAVTISKPQQKLSQLVNALCMYMYTI
jgi:hypothetical protein